jgi:hypothetical protein
MAWKISDRAGDMARGYSLNKKACENTREAIIEASNKSNNNDKGTKKS